ncbi:MAG: PEP-CTERM sorting domain-containing protein [Verrucomicrobiota bacterium JB022]|nr:PEP-CTERM sorting domain-containing protein [Verrucomicrobiota bacterium JB022]
MRNLFSLAALAIVPSVQALEFSFLFSDTLSQAFGAFDAETPVTITIALDNGGTSVESQIWTPADLQSIEFNIGNGGYVATIYTPFGGTFVSGNTFETDADGNVSSSNFYGYSADSTNYTVTDGDSVQFWSLYAGYDYLLTSTGSVQASNSLGVTDPANWSQVGAVPEPSTVAAFAGLGALGLIALRRKRA